MKQVVSGQEFKNYKSLCEYLDEPVKTGKAKQLQLQDWSRYFQYRKDGHKFIIDSVLDVPAEKSQRTSNNIKNIDPMIRFLQCIDIDYKCHSLTNWYYDILGLLNKHTCNIVFNEEDIVMFCQHYHINDETLFCKYISFAKTELKKMLLKSLNYLQKKNLIEYFDGYFFIYALGKKSHGYVNTDLLNDVVKQNESLICDRMNKEHGLSSKLVGRQNLFLIYKEEKLVKQFDREKIKALMENQNALDILNDKAQSQSNFIAEINSICEERPLLHYNRVIAINAVDKKDYDTEVLGQEISNIIRKKVRQLLFKYSYKNKHSGESYYPYITDEACMDMVKIEKLLFQYYDKNFDDGTNLILFAYDTVYDDSHLPF